MQIGKNYIACGFSVPVHVVYYIHLVGFDRGKNLRIYSVRINKISIPRDTRENSIAAAAAVPPGAINADVYFDRLPTVPFGPNSK